MNAALLPTTDARAELVAALRAGRSDARHRFAAVVAGGAVLALAFFFANLLVGLPTRIGLADALWAITGRARGLANFVVFETRLPRAVGALLAGVLFGVSGHLYQRVVRNPLATPDIIGITSGATAGAVAAIVLAPSVPLGVQAAGLLGALLATAVVFALTWRGGLDTYRLVLVGIGVSAVGVAVTSYLLTFADRMAIAAVLRWSTGTASYVQWPDAGLLAIVLAVAVVAVLPLVSGLSALGLGDDLARGLGVRVVAVRVVVLVVGAVAAALTTSVVGPIGFVALIAGPIAARLAPRGPHLLPAALVGAVLVLSADLAAQQLPPIAPVPTGVLTGLVGAPVFVWLLLRSRAGAA
ncbi:FecCD family ABC transporter permease [Micropruina sp.]|uniref:FecCD family ABC transporter permease n=1 Tax=Micropruina sp. TaxID=2737536 RepID=UPI0039E24477